MYRRRLLQKIFCFVSYFQLKKQYPDAHLKLPGKKLFGNFDPAFIKHRREGLHDFIQKIISHPKLMEQ